MTKIDHAHQLREDTKKHYNCSQASFLPFCKELGIDEDTAYKIAANFGSGMRHGSTCGAVSGVLMALGLAGKDEKTAAAFLRKFREKNGSLICHQLLANHSADKKEHCDTMVYDAVAIGEELIK
ncbi:MAG: C-GCAxxG-C-C family protein [Oscillospiraceae bacterium]|nr:C-GCAxxG-C-C family protein [Oscillospiraceae bacterium]